WNDFFQGILTIVMSLLLIPFVMHALGGVSGVAARMPDVKAAFSLVAPGEIGLYWILAAAINQMFSVVVAPHIMSNMAAGKSELDNRVGFAGGTSVKRLCTIAWALIGVLAIAYYGPGKMQGDFVFGALIRDLLPAGFVGLMIACIMASVMDNCAVFVITTSALFTRNVLRVFRREGGDERLELWVSRIFSVVYVGVSIGLAYSLTDVPSGIRLLWNVQPLIGISFWLGLWWRRANRYGAWASFIGASIAWGAGVYVFKLTGDAGLPYLMTLYLVTGIAAGAIVSLLTAPEPELLLDRFYLTINTPVGQEHKLERFQNPGIARRGGGAMKPPVKPDWYPKLVDWANWEIPTPGKEAVAGFFVVLAVSLMLHGIVLWLCAVFKAG
ncbi:MAG: hypothetical protein ABIZ80_13305, partial [Bryobacteraceae bacterium]